jgi:hypothetical protein
MARSLLRFVLATYLAILSFMLVPLYTGVVLLLAACSDNDQFGHDSAAAAPRERVHRSRRRSAAMNPHASTTTTTK